MIDEELLSIFFLFLFSPLLLKKGAFIFHAPLCTLHSVLCTAPYTKAESWNEAQIVLEILKTKYGCSNLRIQIIDFELNYRDNLRQLVYCI